MTNIAKRPRNGRGRVPAVNLGAKQSDVALATGIPQPSLSKMLSGKLPMSDADIEAIVAVTGEGVRATLKKVQKKPVEPLA